VKAPAPNPPDRPPWQVATSLIAAASVLVGSGIAAWRIPAPKVIPAFSLNSPWVFHGEVFVACPVAVAVVWVVLASILTGEPFQKLGLGPVSLERQQVKAATKALVEGGAALEAAGSAMPGGENLAFKAAMARYRESVANLEKLVGE
jgi:hypothetical protein